MKEYYYTYDTIIGKLTFIERNNKLKELIFGNINKDIICKETKLIKESYIEIEEYLNKKRRYFDIPLEINGTEFQKKVWMELLNIPYGDAITYQELARRIGNGKAIRAVGGACNKNKLPIFIPCHRVIGKNNKLIGYNGGLKIKENLLNIERTK